MNDNHQNENVTDSQARTEQAILRTKQAEVRTELANTRADEANTRTKRAELRTEKAETSEQRMRASELSYRRLFEAARDGILILDVDTGRIDDVNPFLVELLGFPHSEMVGKTVGELSPFKDIESNKVMLERLQKDEYIRYEDLPLETRDGRKIAVEFVCNVYQAGDKKVIQCNIRDITERKRVETALIRLAAIVESSDDAIMGKDLIGIITSWNNGAKNIFGYSADEMVGTSIMRLIPEDRQGEEAYILDSVKHGKSVENFETIRQGKDGRLIDVSVTASPIKDTAGKVIGVAKVAHDITARKASEAALRMSEGLYHTLFDYAPDGIVIANPNSYYLDANPSICRMLGYTHDELVGLHAANIVIPSEIKNIVPALGAIKARSDYHREWQFRRKDGSVFPAEVMATTMPDGNLLGMIRDVTERKRTEEELNITHEKLRQLLTHSPAVIYTLKIDGETITPVVVSDNIEMLLGFTVQESSSRGWWARNLHPEDRERVLKAFDSSLTKDGYSMDYRMLHKDGTYRWVEDNNRVLRGADGRVNFMVGVWIDISGRKNAEEILLKTVQQESGRKNTRAFWDLAVIFGLAAMAEAFVYFTDVLEPPLDRLVFKFKDNLDDLFAPPIILLAGFLFFSYRRWRDAQSKVSEQTIVQEAMRKLHGELEMRVEQRTTELTKSNNTLQTEITGRKRAQDESISKTALLEAQMDSTLDGILVVDEHRKIILKNQRLLQLFKIPDAIASDNGDGKLREFVTSQTKNPKQFAEDVDFLYEHPDEIGRAEIELVDGLILDRYSAPIRNKAGKHFGRIWTFRDITGQRKLEGQFRQSQKMDAIGQLASGVAHDFNNILGIIQLQAELLKAEGGLSPAQSEFADEIGVSTQRAAALTRQLLLFSRKETLQLRDMDLNDSINELTKMLRRILGDDVQLRFKFSMQPLFIHADSGMMDQVLMNLVVNARDAMSKGGQLIIETSMAKFDEAAAAHSAQVRPGEFVCLSVSDTGCGIPRENLQKIFEPFFTTKDVGKGTGLGLATVFGIVQQHNGWIDVYSEVGLGTTFRIYLPRLANASGQKSVQPATGPERGGHETILLVEDEPRLRASVQKILSRLGYKVLEASDGVSALEVWRQNRDEISLLLTDMVMPGGMTGRDLGEQLLKENPKLKVVYASGYSAEIAGKDFPLEEGVNFITKPFQTLKLAQTMRQNLDVKN
jgi:PAS domain S-box-containing protein